MFTMSFSENTYEAHAKHKIRKILDELFLENIPRIATKKQAR